MQLPAYVVGALVFAVWLNAADAQKSKTVATPIPGSWPTDTVDERPTSRLAGTITIKNDSNRQEKTTVLKGLAVKVGEATICYDLDRCRVAAAWTGGFTTPKVSTSNGDYATSVGKVVFTTAEIPGLLDRKPISGRFSEASSSTSWPLPQFKGFHDGNYGVMIDWQIGESRIQEIPSYHKFGTTHVFSRQLSFETDTRSLLVPLVKIAPGYESVPKNPQLLVNARGDAIGVRVTDSNVPNMCSTEDITQERIDALPPEARTELQKFVDEQAKRAALEERAFWGYKVIDGHLCAGLSDMPGGSDFYVEVWIGPRKEVEEGIKTRFRVR